MFQASLLAPASVPDGLHLSGVGRTSTDCVAYQPRITSQQAERRIKLIRKGKIMKKWLSWMTLGLLSILLSGCGYNQFQARDEAVKAAWGEVVNQYQRRADLVPNLVNTVKGYASHERETLEAVTKARAAATSVQVTPEVLNDPQAFQRFQQAQGQLTQALSRLLAVSENYPQLKADGLFRDLQSQLEGTENRITVARQRYIKSVEEYNVLARSFPTNLTAMMFGYPVRPSFTVDNEKAISNAPAVNFGK
jgi:LemA protein